MKDKKFYIAAKALFTNPKGQILILRKVPRRADQKWRPFWDIPGGKIRGNDGIKETLLKEVKEELGIDKFNVKGTYALTKANFEMHSGDEKIGLFLIVYKCSLPHGAKLRLSSEHNQYKWASPNEAKKLLTYMFPTSFRNLL